jgi:glutathione peroxidase
MTIYDYQLNRIDGSIETLSKYKDKVLLIVNVASECGLTPQYRGLQKLYETYSEKGFEILAFPSNDFAGQEPAPNSEIALFCEKNFSVTFPLFEKISVKGKEIHPFYEFLTSQKNNPDGFGEVKWNFQKFIISRKGVIEETLHPQVEPLDASMIMKIENML